MRRKQIYRIIIVIMGILLLAGAFPGCGHGTESVTEETSELDYGSSGSIVIGFAQIGSESDWRIANTESFREVFTEENGYYLILEDAQQKQENQVKAIRKFILQDVDYIVLDPIVETGWEAVLQEAKDAGIPVILSDRKISVKDEDLYTCWIGSDFEKEGRRAGNWLERYIRSIDKEGETLNLVTLQGTKDSTAQLGRSKGFQEVLENNPSWNMLEEVDADFTQAKGQEVMEYFLKTYKDIDVVICQNDNMAFGAIEAIEQYGKKIGSDGDIIILSFDGMKDALEELQKGNIIAEFECNPWTAVYVERAIKRMEKGEVPEKKQSIEETYFDYEMEVDKIIEKRSY